MRTSGHPGRKHKYLFSRKLLVDSKRRFFVAELKNKLRYFRLLYANYQMPFIKLAVKK